MNNRVFVWASWAVVAGGLAVVGYWLLFTTFMVYDDEGYVLWSLRTYVVEGGLYDRVFSQYGPFFYVVHDALAWLRLPLDNTSARWLTLGYWGGCALLGGLIAWRLTSRRSLAGAAAVLVFATLTSMISEPGHPGGMLSLLAAVGALGGLNATLQPAGRGWHLVVVVGVLMLLTKINVGTFFLASAIAWGAIHARSDCLARCAPWLVATAAAALPLLLMRSLWPEQWVAIYALVFVCAALGLTLTIAPLRVPAFGSGWWMRCALLAGMTGGAAIAVVIIRGTTLPALIEGVIFHPLRHPTVYSNAVRWPSLAPILAMASLALAVLIHRHSAAPWRAPLLATLRLIAGFSFLSCVLVDRFGALASFSFKFGPSLAWLMAIPLQAGPATSKDRARLWLAWTFAWQTLQAYPVAGSQVAWGSFLWTPLAIVGWHEAAGYWMGRLRGRTARLRVLHTLLPVAAGVVAWAMLAQPAFRWYHIDEPLDLPGAANLRLPRGMANQLRIIARNIDAHGGTLFSLPGMFSFNIWTKRPTPTTANVTHWFSLLDDAQQQAAIERLAADPRAVVVVHPPHIDYLRQRNLAPAGRLHDYLLTAFEPAIRLHAYELWVHRGRSIAPLSTGSLTADDASGRWRLEFVTAAAAEPQSIEWHRSELPYGEAFALPLSAASPWEVRPLNAEGTTAGDSVVLTEPHALPKLARVVIRFTLPLDSDFPPHPHLILRGADGRVLDRLRLRK